MCPARILKPEGVSAQNPRRGRPAPLHVLFVLLLLVGGGAVARSQVIPGQYIVRLRSAPILAHLPPHLPGARAALREGSEALTTMPELKQHIAVLRAEQRGVRERLRGHAGLEVIGQTELTLNSLIIDTRGGLPANDIDVLRRMPEVAEIYPSVLYHKTLDAALQLVRAQEAWNARLGGEAGAGEGVKIAIIDTGLDITHPMLQDATLVVPAGFPKFTQSADAFCIADDQRFTNNKVIVARNYVRLLPMRDANCDAMDRDGHGTFSSTVAAGRRVAAPLASIAGVAPRAYLGSYKVFGTPDTNGSASLSAVLAALDDAVRDGMDVINLSLGADLGLPPSADPLALAVKAAVNAGVVVIAAAGNDGPGSGTITSPGIAPEAITVGATTNARTLALPLEISSTVAVPATLRLLPATLGANLSLAVPIGATTIRDVLSAGGDGTACSAITGALTGVLALIERGGCSFQTKITNAVAAGAAAVILFNHLANQPAINFTPGTATQIPSVMIGNAEGRALRSFLQSTTVLVAGRIGAVRQPFLSEANRVAAFSSAGPNSDFSVKPDLSAPGVNIYAGTQRNFTSGDQFDASGFGISQGTSVSAPMVAGAAAIIRQLWPQFTPAQVKSTLVQTAANALPTADGVSGVMAGGSGVLDLQAAAAAPAVIVPSSISLGANQPGTQFTRTIPLTITNAGAVPDTFTPAGEAVQGSASAAVRFNPESLTLAGGASATLSVTLDVPSSANGIVEGRVVLHSYSTGRSLAVPYWGNFLRPVVNLTGVVNAASFTSGSPRIAAGSLISIFGTQLATTTLPATVLPLPTALAGVRVVINDVEAPLLFVSPSQINAQVPYEIANATLGLLRVELHGQTSAPVPLQIALAAPGIFTLNASGAGRGAVLHGVSGVPVSDASPARPGEVLSVFASGLGATSPAAISGAAATSNPLQTTSRAVAASVGGLNAPVSFSGLAPGFAGLYQVNVQVPEPIADGEHTLIITTADVASNPVTIPVRR